ncbi:MFS transporter [Ectothiorhodospiraceae bacterium BW-2]|nr:MFS transporter [Ectothiorhodospiraceae bacterium BW-2]
MAGFFPLFFKQYWSAGSEPGESTLLLGLANVGASLAIVILAPLLGAMADRCGGRKRYLFRFALLGMITTALLPLVGAGEWGWAVLLYMLATIGFSGSISFYDALLLSVSSQSRYDRVSALGYGLGYLGGGVLFALCVAMSLKPELFGLADAAAAVKLSFLLVALWWLLFSLPLLFWVKEPRREAATSSPSLWQLWRDSFTELGQTLSSVRSYRPVWLFLLAYWCYIDGVDTIIRMAVDYGLALGFESSVLIQALLLTQFIGFPAAILFGYLGQRWGTRRAILLAIGGYMGIVVWGYGMSSEAEFYQLAVAIGLIQGGIQALSRSLYGQLIPPAKAAEFFGFYNMLGKFAALLGPLLMGVVSWLTGDPRLSILTLLPLFAIGGWLLLKVPLPAKRGLGAKNSS